METCAALLCVYTLPPTSIALCLQCLFTGQSCSVLLNCVLYSTVTWLMFPFLALTLTDIPPPQIYLVLVLPFHLISLICSPHGITFFLFQDVDIYHFTAFYASFMLEFHLSFSQLLCFLQRRRKYSTRGEGWINSVCGEEEEETYSQAESFQSLFLLHPPRLMVHMADRYPRFSVDLKSRFKPWKNCSLSCFTNLLSVILFTVFFCLSFMCSLFGKHSVIYSYLNLHLLNVYTYNIKHVNCVQ